MRRRRIFEIRTHHSLSHYCDIGVKVNETEAMDEEQLQDTWDPTAYSLG
jgi:hypothetical protein